MMVCCVVYVVLAIFAVLRKREQFPKWGRTETGKRMLLVLAASNTIAISLFLADRGQAGNVESVRRNVYGGGKKSETYEVTVGDAVRDEEIVVDVEERMYTSQEIKKIFQKVIKEMDKVILGENESFDRVEKDMNLVTEWKEYPIQIQWELDKYEVMDSYGKIQEDKTKKEGTLVELQATLSYGKEQALYVANAMIYPETKSEKGAMLNGIEELFKTQEEETREQETFFLPQKIEGERIYWKRKKDTRGYVVLMLGCVGAVALFALKKQNEDEEKKKRQAQMLTDYPEIVNKVTLLLSTGMTVKTVWERIVRNYEEQKSVTGIRAAYEEMGNTYYEMQGGIAEAEAYERFGRRCEVSAYIKFGALLAQNIKKGAKGMSQLLQMESLQAFEDRKSRTRQLGEEAGTKLLMPMFGMLAVVLVIVVVPAFLSMQL